METIKGIGIMTKYHNWSGRRRGRNLKTVFILNLLAGFLFCLSLNIFPQDTGAKYMKNYSAREYKWNPQNWSIVQDKRGCIYVGNQGALLEFDGVSWRTITIPNLTVRSLAVDDSTGAIYIGGKNELGFLALDADGKGTLEYKSLLGQLEKDFQNFDEVMRIHVLEDGIYYRTYYYLFRLQSGAIKVIAGTDGNHRFRHSFDCGGKLFIIKNNVGLMQLKGDTLALIPGGEIFADKKVFMLAPYPEGKMLIGTESFGLYLYDETMSFKPFESEAGDYLKRTSLAHGIRLRCGDYALATKFGGLIIMNPQGRVKRYYNRTHGLQEDLLKFVYEDTQGNLWLAQEKGIAKIEHASPFTLYDDRSGLARMVLAVAVNEPGGKVYAGTTDGIFYLDGAGQFHPIPGINQECRYFLSTGDCLLAATKNGVFSVDKEKPLQITRDPSFILYVSPNDEKRIWIGTNRGLASLYRSGTAAASPQWKPEPSFETIDREIHSIAEDREGNLWLGTLTEGALKVVFPGGSTLNNPVVTKYDAPGELNLEEIHVFFAAGHVMFATINGIYRFEEKTDKLISDLTFGEEYAGGGGKGVFRIVEDADKHIWLHSKYRNIEAIPQADGTFLFNDRPFLRIPSAQVNMIYPDPKADAVWFAGNDGLIRYDETVKKEYLREFHTLIRSVMVNGELFFDGYLSQTHQDRAAAPPAAVFKFKNRNFSIQFAAPFYEDEKMTLYRTFLEEYDRQWSEPTADTRKDYTNLDPGPYIFRVQAENVYRDKGREALFRFKILPPLYKTWWAYLFYAGLAFMAMFYIIKWRSGKLKREKERLEQVVEDRTREINRKNRQLEQQTGQLKEQSEKLTEMDKVKTRFFANISHEFRTPLTLIMGPLEEMMAGLETRENETRQKQKLGLMLRNSQRLLNLINQLLELSKIESGKMILEASLQNIIPFLKGIVESFEPVTVKQQLVLSLEFAEEEIIVNIDAGKMEDVIFNLLSNAVKFTPAGGKITVAVKRAEPGAEFPSGSVALSVRDTGPGISREQLGHIFDRFYQADSTYEHHRKGSGIGLTIARELVELHNGRIDVHSIEGKGSEFIIHLPLGAQTGQLVQTPGSAAGSAITEKIKMMEIQEESENAGEVSPQEPCHSEDPGKNIILVVEDSADTRAYIRSSLEPTYHVVEAKDGKEGIQRAQEVIPDLIVSDIMMPETDGFELCRVLKNRIDTSHIPIILLTAKAGEEDVLEGLETGADDYVTKPFSTRILSARIKNLIELRRHLQQVLDRDMMQHPVKIPVSKIDKEFIARLKEVIKKNISDPDFNIEQLCEKMAMSQPTLYRKIQALSGESPTDFIRSYRLKRGARLLEEKFGSVLEVAFEVGFSSAAYFTKCFKKKYNCLPSQYHQESKV
ncbi:MAG: Response regulator [Acidobacteriota bacterium]|nr:Response regulator [Acidobacteriota bacterium]